MEQQTVVDWLVKKYFEDYNVLLPELEYQQAKEMEEKQHTNTFLAGGRSAWNAAAGKDFVTFEDYYNQTYKKE